MTSVQTEQKTSRRVEEISQTWFFSPLEEDKELELSDYFNLRYDQYAYSLRQLDKDVPTFEDWLDTKD